MANKVAGRGEENGGRITVQLVSCEVLSAGVGFVAARMVANVAFVSVATRTRPTLSATAWPRCAAAIPATVAAAVTAELRFWRRSGSGKAIASAPVILTARNRNR